YRRDEHALHAPHPGDLALEQVGDQVLAGLQLPLDEQDLAAQGGRVLDAVELDERTIVSARAPDHLVPRAGHADMHSELERRDRVVHVEAPSAPVRPAHPARRDLGQSTRSTSTRWSCDAPTARMTVRSAVIVRPRRPIT